MIHDIPPILRYQDLQKLLKVSRAFLARWEAKSRFPKRVIIGDNSIGWRRDEVHQWIQERYNADREI